jgi:excisionase family DNA binding protein
MTAGQESSASTGQSGSNPDGRLVSPQASCWDIDLLTPDDVCALLKVKKSWLYDAVEDGALEAIRLGKQLRFRPSALVRYLDERVSNGSKGRPGDRDDFPRGSRPRS